MTLTSDETTPPGLTDPTETPKNSAPWLKMIADAEKKYREYHVRADNIDKQFADLERLANTTREREMQLFWANISVMAPSCYSRPPVPVVVPRFKSEDELPRTASEMLERAVGVMFEQEDLDGTMHLIRDDLVIQARGASWIRLDKERVRVEHADRKDLLVEPARSWKEVDWVAKCSWLDQDAAGKRFKATSGDAYKSLAYSVRKDSEADKDDGSPKAGVWELWCKSQNKVVWIGEGATVCLDIDTPHLTLDGFFPCPKPAYGTVERRSLLPVQDFLFYKDQIEEINTITDRIAALSDAVKVRGFYAAGQGEVGDAIGAAMKSVTNNTLLVPISNWAALGGVGLKDSILWLPIDMITTTITALVALRKELIEDVYQVTGLSDIMRGQTEASETLGAQQLKSQYGSVRIKDRQDELTRLARDITRICAEIMAENFSGKILMEMSQMPLPSDDDIKKQAAPLEAQLKEIGEKLPAAQQELQALQGEIQQASQDPEVAQMAQKNPDQAAQVMGAVKQHAQQLQAQVAQMTQAQPALQDQLKTLAATVTIDKVMKLLRSQSIRPFILDIETDSTIAPDENAAKQRATEFVTAVGSYLKNSLPLLEQMPQAGPMVGETLKFIVKQFRAGRELQGVIDKFADQMEQKAQQPPPPNPEAIKAQSDAQAAQAKQAQDTQTAQADNAAKTAQAQKDAAEAATSEAEAQRMTLEAQTAAQDADVARKIKVQQELDASDGRKSEIASKEAMARMQIAHGQQKHAQEMEKGALELELIKSKIAHTQVSVAGTLAKDDAAVAAHEAHAKAAAKPKPEATK